MSDPSGRLKREEIVQRGFPGSVWVLGMEREAVLNESVGRLGAYARLYFVHDVDMVVPSAGWKGEIHRGRDQSTDSGSVPNMSPA